MTPPKDQAPGLVATLRAMSLGPRSYASQAADRIEQLEAENARLRKAVKASAEIGRIVGFLEGDPGRVAAFLELCGDELLEKARAALTEQANIRSPVQSEMAKMVDPRKDEN